MFGKFRAPNCLSAVKCNAAENAWVLGVSLFFLALKGPCANSPG